ncbi:hypothetical protein PC129_g15477 [Phytophthora cactorum]|uniref:Uncharacterized protein n=1 Tax=Phytophthora cactorum TaxID=29920 RepID=A0A8T1BEK9_9STRA|nr:hypothetical protein PC111_g15398 [Phytophthora cactorum]KAG2889026.1 hypothetical protein PC114_g18137 [Phytophthora cactorum]KAG2900963.1 hypothetical protein PC115_g16020 [Phytophthora cactorum]KAG2970481.1 hypothetical protein PC118_g16836 [Phytophthora cactorum]KAG2998297.1 hypothetical protein PC119_g17480 [Phytophthora cactorum]
MNSSTRNVKSLQLAAKDQYGHTYLQDVEASDLKVYKVWDEGPLQTNESIGEYGKTLETALIVEVRAPLKTRARGESSHEGVDVAPSKRHKGDDATVWKW